MLNCRDLVGRILLGLLFFLVLTPISWASRMLGYAVLDLKLENERESYWLDHSNLKRTSKRFTSQFISK